MRPSVVDGFDSRLDRGEARAGSGVQQAGALVQVCGRFDTDIAALDLSGDRLKLFEDLLEGQFVKRLAGFGSRHQG